MQIDDVINMAKASGLYETLEQGMPGAAQWVGLDDELMVFAELVAEAEREACAKVCEALPHSWRQRGWIVESSASSMAEDCASGIRERSNAELNGLAPGEDNK